MAERVGSRRAGRRERLAASRLYVCTAIRPDLGEFADTVLGAGVDLIQTGLAMVQSASTDVLTHPELLGRLDRLKAITWALPAVPGPPEPCGVEPSRFDARTASSTRPPAPRRCWHA